MTRIGRQTLFSLAYHSIFDYPLTIEEIHRYLLINRPISLNEVTREVNKLLCHRELCHWQSVAISSGLPRRPDIGSELLAMTGNEKFFDLRLKRHQVSLPKLRLASLAARLIGVLPWIKLVCVTGALAMENADENDDIDLMIVTAKNRLWIVRPLAILLASLFFKRRKPLLMNSKQKTENNDNAICLNLWLDESALAIPVDQRNLYTAHELAQMKPVVNKDGTYEKILIQNRWGKKFLANFWQSSLRGHSEAAAVAIPLGSFASFRMTAGNFLNSFLFYLQFIYMKPKITNERVSLHSAFFHPGNRADTILERYDSFCHRYF